MPDITGGQGRAGSEKERGSGRRRAYHHGAVREMMLAETLVLAAEDGPGAVSLREAARRIGISHSAAYHHFRDKRDLIAAAATEGMLWLAADQEEAENAEAGNPAECVCRLAAAYVRFALRNAGAFRLMFAPEIAHKARYPELRAASDAASAPLLRALSAWRGASGHDEELRELAVSLWSLVHGLSDLALNEQLEEGELQVAAPRHEGNYCAIARRASARFLTGARRV